MQRGLYSACSAMIVQTTYLDVVSNNLANVNTSGFRKRIPVSQSFPDLLMDRIEKVSEDGETKIMTVPPFQMNFKGKAMIGSLSFANVMTLTYMPDIHGSYAVTDNPLDAALRGEGFFTLQSQDGEIYYSRQGTFQLDNAGNIVSSDGMRLVAGGTPVNIEDSASFSFNSDGYIIADGEAVAQLDIVTFENPTLLRQAGSSVLYSETPQSGIPVPVAEPAVLSGIIEKSNVNVVEEMARMIEIQRAYEAASKALMTHDETAGKMISSYSK
jgi:flagellar basal-body rod protein FlgG